MLLGGRMVVILLQCLSAGKENKYGNSKLNIE